MAQALPRGGVFRRFKDKWGLSVSGSCCYYSKYHVVDDRRSGAQAEKILSRRFTDNYNTTVALSVGEWGYLISVPAKNQNR